MRSLIRGSVLICPPVGCGASREPGNDPDPLWEPKKGPRSAKTLTTTKEPTASASRRPTRPLRPRLAPRESYGWEIRSPLADPARAPGSVGDDVITAEAPRAPRGNPDVEVNAREGSSYSAPSPLPEPGPLPALVEGRPSTSSGNVGGRLRVVDHD